MEKLICSCCTAPITPTITQAFLTCEYCGTSTKNPYYDEAAAAEAAKPSLEELCLSTLREMGAAQNLTKLDPDCFGDPINGNDAARMGLSISDAHQMYLLYAHTFLFVAFSDGLALTDGGLYYKCDSGAGSLSWEAFITGAITCVDRNDDQDGTLKIGSTIELAVKSDKDSRLARFLVDFHNHVYHQHTGETAPAAWAVTVPAAAAAEEEKDASLLGTVLPVFGALLGTSASKRKTVAQRTPAMHPTSRPTVRQDRRDHVEPPRPLHSQPHHRSAGKAPMTSARPGSMGRASGSGRPVSAKLPSMQQRPGAASRPSVQPRPGVMNRPGMMGKPGGQPRPGSMSGSGSGQRSMGSSGGQRSSGRPGKGRR